MAYQTKIQKFLLNVSIALRCNVPLGIYFHLRKKFVGESSTEAVSDCALRVPCPAERIKEIAGKYFEENNEVEKNLLNFADNVISDNVLIFNHTINPEDFSVDKFNERRSGEEIHGRDIRFHWEVYRGRYLFNVGLAYLVTGNETYAAYLIKYLQNWKNFSPLARRSVPYNAMEASVKILNLSWLHLFLEKYPQYKPENRSELVSAILEHARYIYKNYEITFYGLESNHGLSCSVGLIYASVLLSDHSESHKWYKLGVRSLLRGLGNQFHDGVNFESSTQYFRYTLEILLIALNAMQYAGKKEADIVEREIGKIGESFISLRHSNNFIPRIGDSDGGKIFYDLGSIPEFNSVEYFDWFTPGNDKMFFETLVFEGNPGMRNIIKNNGNKTGAGNYISVREKNISLVIAGHGIGTCGKGNHQHNDFLSFELYGRKPFIVDPWSYCYTGGPKLRNADRSTSTHNCVWLDNSEIVNFDKARLFQMSGNIKVKIESVSNNDDTFTAVLSHDGYKKLKAGGQFCRRLFRLDKKSNELEIIDELKGSGNHTAEINFTIPAACWQFENGNNETIFFNEYEKYSISSPGNEFEISRGSLSQMFLNKEDSYIFKIRKEYAGDTKIKTIIKPV